MTKTYTMYAESECVSSAFSGLSMYDAYRTAGNFIENGYADVVYIVNKDDPSEMNCIRRSLVDKYRKGA